MTTPIPSSGESAAAAPGHAASAYEFSARDIEGREQSLAAWRGQVLLIVNTASACGFTPQYAGLQALHHAYRPRGFTVLAFPCNQFGAQEPGSAAQIVEFCQTNYGVEFPLFDKVDVNGAHTHPLWRWLKDQASGVLGTEAIKWNFTKFLVGRDGQVIRRYAPQTQPDALRADIEMALAAPAPAVS
ncbi:glutathione peroxidase [Thiomonas sp. FB-6]|uniref:glutathione peroxidase n=1 Tax=Thiomonas sp. FB-6 TaxID=1158291 RepID=UPI00037A3AEA|nr:glutathione peroxidase [Thiomonas sp. FB-6]